MSPTDLATGFTGFVTLHPVFALGGLLAAAYLLRRAAQRPLGRR